MERRSVFRDAPAPAGAMRQALGAGTALVVALLAAGCGSSSGAGAAERLARLPGVGETIAKTCGNEAICTIALDHGARLIVPAGALPAEEVTIRVETKTHSGDQARSHTYVLDPDGTTFAKPLTMEIPVAPMPGEGAERLWCRQSRPGDEAGFDLFDEVASREGEGEVVRITCALTHFSSVSVSSGETFATYRGIRVARTSLDACGQRGFSSEAGCTGALGNAASCSYCGGHDDCWIPGGGGDCCPDESGSLDDRCWLSFQSAPVGAPLDACGGYGFSTYDACVNAGVPGIDCSYCSGQNDCWVPGGGDDCCPGEANEHACWQGYDWDPDSSPPAQAVGGCWNLSSLDQAKSGCGGEGFWTEAACQQGVNALWQAGEVDGVCDGFACGGSCQFCSGHNQCWFIVQRDPYSGGFDGCPGEPCQPGGGSD